MELTDLIKETDKWISEELDNVFEEKLLSDITVKAGLYSLMAGGKRMRPCLMYASSVMLGADLDKVLPFAVSLEIIHTYSLIHDDLPCMDNDDLRRGKPTCHKVYGEGIATLAGDMLLNRAYERLFSVVNKDYGCSYAAFKIADLAGINGMVGGQSIDIDSEGKKITLDTLYELQRKKTGALIEAAIVTPYYIKNSVHITDENDRLLILMKALSNHLGLAFQIKDDILDVTSNPEILGKSTGKDSRDEKPTFVTILGLSGAQDKLNDELNSCNIILDELQSLGFDTEAYRILVKFTVERDR